MDFVAAGNFFQPTNLEIIFIIHHGVCPLISFNNSVSITSFLWMQMSLLTRQQSETSQDPSVLDFGDSDKEDEDYEEGAGEGGAVTKTVRQKSVPKMTALIPLAEMKRWVCIADERNRDAFATNMAVCVLLGYIQSTLRTVISIMYIINS